MNQAISQSLAGRVGILTLLPLSYEELAADKPLPSTPDEVIFNGSYPAIYSHNLPATDFYPSYIHTYVERDVRGLVNLMKLSDFRKFMRLCAGRIGQLLDLTSLANDCGISVPTTKEWLSLLEASYIIFLLQPHFENFNKRLVKSPKLYFYDTGLACSLLRITAIEQLNDHYLRGNLFESFIVAEIKKKFLNQGKEPSVYFWRDNHKKEVVCILDYGNKLIPVEIKSSQTFHDRFFEKISYYRELANIDTTDAFLIYAGTEEFLLSQGNVVSWQNAAKIVR